MKKNISLIVAVSFLLFLLGFLGLSILTGYGLLDYWQQKLQVIVELRDDIEEKDLNSLHLQLETAPFVISKSLNIVTKDEAFDLMKKEFGEEFLSLDVENPLRNIYTFNVQSNFSDVSSLEKIKLSLQENPAVAGVFYEKKNSQNSVKNMGNFIIYAVFLSILFIFVIIFLIQQHIQIRWLSDKNELLQTENRDENLSIYKKENFARNIKNSFWSSAIAIILLMIHNYWVNQNFNELSAFSDNVLVVSLFFSLLIISILCYLITTFILQKKQIIDSY